MKDALDLRQLRKARGWSQVEAARQLRVSQPYLSPASLDDWGAVTDEALAKRLAALGYVPFAHLRTRARPENPAAVLLWALSAESLDPRLIEALPWLLLHFADLDTAWLVREAKVRNLQNRLGFLVSLTKEVAARDARHADRLDALTALEATLERARLVREDTLCEATLGAKTREAVRRSRSPAAAHWNLVTGWKAEHLRYDP